MNDEIKDEWFTAEGLHEGRRLIVRLNSGAQSMTGDKRYPFKVGIAIPFKSPLDDGMPNKDELQRFTRIEDTIFNRFEIDNTGVLCTILTTHGMREFVLYSKTDNVTEIIEDISLHFPEYNMQHNIERDNDWDEFNYWAKRLSS